ncbi:MAG: potassium/proton antiporter [Pseudomonadales bacterium]
MIEPIATGWILLGCGILLAVSAMLSRASQGIGIPVFLLFLILGMLAGSEGPGGIIFESYDLGFRIGLVALALILFDGGLNTPYESVKRSIGPALVLSTVGVVGTMLIVALFAYYLGFPLLIALLAGAIVSSTDAAAVFSTLRAGGVRLKRRVGTTLELESGLNDPVAVILTIGLTHGLLSEQALSVWLVADVVWQLAIGGLLGLGTGFLGRKLLQRMELLTGGLYPVLTLAIAFLAFGLTTLLNGSGFLAVYLAGLVIGNGWFPYRSGVQRFHDATAWLSQVSMFILLGLLVFPSELLTVALPGILLAAVLVFIARPLVVAICLLPFGFPIRETLFVGWIGLRGAVPIVLAIYPVLAQVPGSQQLFNVVFFIVVLTAIIPGGTVSWVARRLNLASDEPAPPRAMIEIDSLIPISGQVSSYFVHANSAVSNSAIRDLPLSDRDSVLLVLRGDALIVPRGSTVLEPGDHVYVFCQTGDAGILNLLFGRQEIQ